MASTDPDKRPGIHPRRIFWTGHHEGTRSPSSGLTVDMQNHTVIYYDALSATMLNKLWANPFNPNRKAVSFPEGGMVVKAAGVTPTPEQWPVLEGSAIWNVYRPTVEAARRAQLQSESTARPQVVPLRVLQFDIIVKDSVASPQTGWVFVTYVYDKDARRRDDLGQAGAARRHVGQRPGFRQQSERHGSERRSATGDMDQSGSAGLCEIVARLGRPAVRPDRRRRSATTCC